MAETERKPLSIKEVQKVLEWLPGATILLIAVGYINHHVYYTQFGIPIYNFITASEILLLFVPFVFNYIQNFISIIVLIISCSLLLYYIIKLPHLLISEQSVKTLSKENKEENEKKLIGEVTQTLLVFDIGYNLNQISSLIKEICNAPFKLDSMETYFQNVYEIFIKILGILFVCGMIYLGFTILQPNQVRDDGTRIEAGLLLILILIVIAAFELFTLNFFKYVLELKRSEKFNYYWSLCKNVIYSGFFFYMCITAQFINIIHNQADYNISFSYNNVTVKTNDKLVFVGATQKYIFLRDLRTNDNNIFKIDSVGKMAIKKIDYTYEYFPAFKNFNKK